MNGKRLLSGLLLVTAVALVAGCGAAATETVPADAELAGAQDTQRTVVAEAVIEPARSGEVSVEMPGDVVTVFVEEGDEVEAGDLLLQLDTEDLDRALAQARISLEQVKLRLKQLQDPPEETDVESAQAAIEDATAVYDEALSSLALAENSVAGGDQIRALRFVRDEAYERYLQTAEKYDADHWRVRWAYDDYLGALGEYNRAVEDAELQVLSARNQVSQAASGIEQAEVSLETLLEGADDLDVKALRLDVRGAELAIEEAASRLEDAVLTSPFAGIVADVDVEVGDAASVGQPVMALATLDELEARTTDLTELDVARVEEGQPVKVTVDALPDQAFDGMVREISLQPGDYRGDVVYQVVVDLTDSSLPEELRWGMTALVEIETR